MTPDNACDCAARLESEADKLSADYAAAATTTPSFLIGDDVRVKMWRGIYYREAAEWLRTHSTSG